jgi:hypothetical protein
MMNHNTAFFENQYVIGVCNITVTKQTAVSIPARPEENRHIPGKYPGFPHKSALYNASVTRIMFII